ncbi:MAG: hypothetical protein ACPLZC_03265 [Candidatus Bathyarchaeales archaeon]
MRRITYISLILPFCLLLVLSASAAEPRYIPNGGFYGYVKDNRDIGIPGVKVQAGDYTSYTDSSGYYYIFTGQAYSTLMTASKEGYLTQQKKASTSGSRPTRVDFQLADDADAWITLAAAFPNTIYAEVIYTEGFKHTIIVHAWTGMLGTDVVFTEEVGTSFVAPGGSPTVRQRFAKASGVYDASGKLLDAFIRSLGKIYRTGPYVSEYLSPQGQREIIAPGRTVSGYFYESGSIALQKGLKVSVGFSIMGVSASFPLEETLSVESGYTVRVDWKIHNTDYVTHSFLIYVESNYIVHIWQEY